MRMYGCMALLSMCWALSAPAAAQSGERVALVVGNSGYGSAPLINPRNDAQAMTALLTKAGFAVDQRLDATQADLMQSIERFGAAIRDPKVKFGLFYYAGHGLQQNWRNYLVPVSAEIHSAEEVPAKTVDVSELLAFMGQAKGRSFLVILDACRDDPFGGTYRPTARGLSQFDAPSGSMLAYATAPGSVAFDGEGANGLYTSSLLQEFSVEGAKLEDAFKRVTLNVRMASHGRQVPWETTSLEQDIYLFPVGRRKLSEADQEAMLDEEMSAWTRVRSAADVNLLADFLRRYPSGYVSELALSRLIRLLAVRDEQEEAARRSAVRVAELPANPQQNAIAAASPVVRPPVVAVPVPEPVGLAVPVPQPELPQTALAPTPFSQGYAVHSRQYRVGDQFRFTVIDGLTRLARPLELKVTGVDLQSERVEFNDGGYASDMMGNIVANDRGVFSTPRQFYPAELYVGKKWQTMFRQKRPNGTTYTFKYDVRVVGRETVTVPAGTFDTFKIEARGFNMQLGASLLRTIWVAPGVAADIVHETVVRLRNSTIDQFDRQELVSVTTATR
jgi:hypothetical protein